ncbi:MAG TPA: type I-E CRISPR-associated protein Cas6/Cse3/CasE [Micromonosporaceae bacterium]|nr:type I-E CRISPR-associated protein Cas6/Cse3/CasE [Micromonosporaceae bacterium]
MFLTRMAINTRRRGARTLVASPQAMHAAVMAGFADKPVGGQGERVLWRLDTYSPHRVLLYTVSPEKPDFTHLVEQAGWPTTQAWETRCYQRLLDGLQPGQRWQFRLTANPVRAGRREGWHDTKPLGHVTVEQQERWLIDRAEKAGFRLVPCAGSEAVDLTVVERSVRRFRRQNGRVTVSTATFEGTLEIVDPAAMRTTLTRGIGRAKAYGCGLLTLARPRHDAR